MKGGNNMPSIGYIQVNAYTSNARLPLKDVAITVTATDGTAIAMGLTDRSGRIAPISIPVPDPEAGLTPDTGELPFARVNLYARLNGFVQIENEDLQVFPNTITEQNLELIPLSELPGSWSKREIFKTPSQNL
jgi:hypothetical protein